MICRCGREAVGMFLKGTGIFVGVRETKEREPACGYHLEKAKKLGYQTELLAVIY